MVVNIAVIWLAFLTGVVAGCWWTGNAHRRNEAERQELREIAHRKRLA